MKKLIVLTALLALTAACFDDDDYRDPFTCVLALAVGTSCPHAPFGIYLDGREPSDRVAEIPQPGGSVLMALRAGAYAVYVRDAEGAWIFEDDIQLRQDRTIIVECAPAR
jgi:hypothetical protein